MIRSLPISKCLELTAQGLVSFISKDSRYQNAEESGSSGNKLSLLKLFSTSTLVHQTAIISRNDFRPGAALVESSRSSSK